ncbi:MAG: TIR domain-containing protein [Ruminococcus sp.]|nr:TIR domain-containing protein [Ruminococcus sp.]
MKKSGGWVFISHSHLDIDLVRKIRNALESKGFEPLLFYLKCLNDADEIEDLIKREIKEREWFIYVDSPNAQQSVWVRSELDYIQQFPDKKVFVIDLHKDIDSQIEHIQRQLQVFISYSRKDYSLMKKISDKLTEHDFLVFTDQDLMPGELWSDQLHRALDDSIHSGFVILIITDKSLQSSYVSTEIEYTIANGGKVVPIYVDDAYLNSELLYLIGDIQGIRVHSDPTDDELEKVLSDIQHRIKFYKSDFTDLIGFQSARTIIYPQIGIIEDYTFWDCYCLEEVTIPDSVQYISEKAFRENQDILIKCTKGSYAEKFCIDHNIRYQIIDID